MAWSSPRTWVTGELVTAAHMNQEVKDNLNAIVPVGPDAFPTWTPTVTQSGSVTATITRATYMKAGRLVVFFADLAITGAGTISNAITIGGLPFTGAAAAWAMGSFRYFDTSVPTNYAGTVQASSATAIQFYAGGTIGGALGVAPAFAAASGDVFRMWFQGEVTT